MTENADFQPKVYPMVEIPSYEYEELLAAREVCSRLVVGVGTDSAMGYWEYLHDAGCDIRNGVSDV